MADQSTNRAVATRGWILEQVAELLQVAPGRVEPDIRLRDQGLDSVLALALLARLEAHVGRSLPKTLPWRHPTVNAIAHFLDGDGSHTSQQADVTALADEPIAIVGLGCRFPGAASPEAFWRLLVDGIDAVSKVPLERWDPDRWYDSDPTTAGKSATRWGGFLEQVDRFDPAFFGISSREAREMDPQQRLFLEVAWEALESGGIVPRSLVDSATGVFAGAMWHDWDRVVGDDPTRIRQHSATGHDTGIIAGRLSYLLGARGPSLTVNTACSSSLVAVHLAVQSLQRGECTRALAGAVNLILSPLSSVAMTKFGAMAPDGRCKAFDARANGYVRGEGVGVVVLERLSLALERGAPIFALIRGSAINNDGYSNGLTAPSGDAQEAVLARAWAVAGIPPTEVDYVEAHGPGTYLGDPIEAEAIGAVFSRQRDADERLLLGSVKTNLGHLEAAAGMAGLIKTTLALHHGVIPPNLHFETPNPNIDFDALRLQIPTQALPWPRLARPRRAGVSSFGFGGTNAHVALCSAPGGTLAPAVTLEFGVDGERTDKADHELVFVFAGHGGQWVGMGQALLQREPEFRAAVEACDAALRPLIGWSVLQRMCSLAPGESPDVIQPLLFAVQVGLARTLASRGVRPSAVIGQSIGEVAAAHVAGHLSLEDAAAVIAARARLAAEHLAGAGAVMVVRLGAEELKELPAGLTLAGKISPTRTLVAGDPTSLAAAADAWQARGVRCVLGRVGYASHSPQVEPILEALQAALATITPRVGTIPWWSTTLGSWAQPRSADARYWARNIRDPFDLLGGLRELGRERTPIFLEIGPHPVLGSAIQETIGGAVEALACMFREQDEYADLHALLETLHARGLLRPVDERRATLVPVTATTAEGLERAALALQGHLARHPEVTLDDVAWTMLRHRSHHAHRVAMVVDERGALLRGLARVGDTQDEGREPSSHDPSQPVIHRGHAHEGGNVAFVFPGQGAQWVGMGRRLLLSAPAFAEALDACDQALRPETGWSVREILLGLPRAPSLERIEVIQPTLWAVMVSLAALWRSWGIEPDMVIGHSQGEIAAACVAGALSLADGARIVARRSRLLRRIAGRGAMAAIGLGVEALMELLPDDLSLAVVNGSDSTVVAGEPQAVATWVEQLRERGVFARMVDVDIASHSPQIDALRGFLHFEFRELAPARADVTMISTVFDREFTGEELDGSYWIENLRRPVRFDRALRRAIQSGAHTFIEISAHPLLTGAIERGLADLGVAGTVVGSLRRRTHELETMLDSLARLFVAGVSFDPRPLLAPGQIVPLPTSVFTRERFWPPPPAAARGSGPRPTAAGGWMLELEIDPHRQTWLGDHRVHGTVVVPGIALISWMLETVARAPGSWAIEDAILEVPLILDGRPRELQISAQRVGNGYVVELFASKGETWVRHARGRLILAVDFPVGEMPALDEAKASPPPYAEWAATGNEYGPSFRGIERFTWGEDDTLIADIALPGGDGSEIDGVHPALLDAALQLLLIDAPADQANALFTANLRLFRSQARRVRVLAKRTRGPLSGELTLWDRSDGGLLAHLGEVSLLPVDHDDLASGGSVNALQLVWRPEPIEMVAPSRRCLLVTDAITANAEQLHALMREAGCEVELVLREDLRQVLFAGATAHVIGLWTTPEGPADQAALALVQAAVEELRVVVDAGASSTWVTFGAQSIASHAGSPVLASLWGLGRVLQREHPELRHRLIDLGDDKSLALLTDALLTDDREDQVLLVDGRRLVRRLVPAREIGETSWPGGAVLITGGTGFVGRQLARWLLEHGGADQVFLAGRQPASAAAIEQLEDLGDAVHFVQCDVTDRAALEGLLATLPALTGVIHGAMSLRDAPLATLTSTQIAEVMAPKVRGALLLHELCRAHTIERFVLLSSMASVLGNPGQGAYAAANAFLDGLAEQRHALGLPAQSQSWGIWTNQSQRLREHDRERFRRAGVRPLDAAEGVQWFASAWKLDSPHLLLVPVDWDQFSRSLTWTPPLLDELVSKITRAPSEAGKSENIDSLVALERAIELEVLAVLGHSSDRGLERDVGFAEQGLDSLMSVTLKGRLEQRLGLQLPATIAFNYPTLTRMVRHLAGMLGLSTDRRATRQVVANDRAAIAVIGMACRFPSADSPDDLWSLLLAGGDAIAPIPRERFDIEPWYDPDPDTPGHSYVRTAGLIDDVDAFDIAYFQISPREARSMDPQQGLLLEVGVNALEDAGITLPALDESAAGVFVGALNYDHGALLLGRPNGDWIDGFAASGTRSSVLSGRLSHFLGVHGPSLTVDTACSSSLTAIHLAVRSLRAGECDLAIAGGVNALLSPLTLVERSKNRMLSPTGHCRPFDADADGIAIGEGCGMVVLKRLSDAMLAGDRIRAVIRGSALNHDGRTSGLTVPSGPAQRALLRAAIVDAGVQPEEIGYVEAHGTGTALGDPIELEALAGAMRLADDTPLWIGSLKANLGHLESASGVAGFIKAVLALEHGVVPPQIHFEQGNPLVPWDSSPLRVPREPTALSGQYAGVSSFGFSGTNVHVVLERGLSPDDHDQPVAPPLLLLSARDQQALEQLRARWCELLTGAHQPLADLCYTAAHRRGHHLWRLAAAGTNGVELAERLRSAPLIRVGRASRSPPKVVFVFAGQGGVWRGMGRALIDATPEVRQIVEDIDGLVLSLGGTSVLEALRDDSLEATELAQPALFALEVALVTWFSTHGIRPDAVVGHSVGELAAAWACGALPLFEACRLVVARAAVMATLRGSGAMLAVGIGPGEVEAMTGGSISVAAINGPAACVLAGPFAALERVRAELTGAGRFARWVSTDYAFHSPAVTAASLRLHKLIGSVETSPAEVPLYSTVDGGRRDGPLDLGYWIRNMVQPVRFADAIAAAAADMDAVFVELSPHPALQVPIAQQLAGRIADQEAARVATVATLRRDGHGQLELAEAAGQLHALGVPVELERLVPQANVTSLPTYPWQRQRHRLADAPAAIAESRLRAGAEILIPPPGWSELVRLDQPRPTWEAAPVDREQFDAGALITLLLTLIDAPILDALMAASSNGVDRVHIERTRAGVEVWADAGQGWRELLNANLGATTALATWTSDTVWEPYPRSVLEAELALLGHALGAGVTAIDRGRSSWRLRLEGVTSLRAFELARALASLIHGEPRVLGGWGRLQGRTAPGRVGALIITHTKIVMFDQDGRELLLVEATQWDQDRAQLTPRVREEARAQAQAAAAAGAATTAATGRREAPVASLLAELRRRQPSEREDLLADWIEQQAKAALMIEGELAHDEGLFALGMDSLLAISLLTSLAKALEVPLANTLVFEHPTVADLARVALKQVRFDTVPEISDPAPDHAPAITARVTLNRARETNLAERDVGRDPRLDEPIAVIGVACRLPGADSPAAFWRLLEAGGDAVTTVPAERWRAEDWTDSDPDHAGRMVSAAGGFLDDVAHFDPAFFGISPREAERMDPQQRLLLEVGYEAFEHAGWPTASLRGSATGVFIGIGTEDFGQLQFHGGPAEEINAYDFTGVDTSVAAGRLSHTWGLQGPCMAIDTACSSSLVALHLAAQSLRLGECDRALVGGVNVMLAPELGVFLTRARAMSPSGRCRTFDKDADGYVRGEGCVVFALRRLSDAERDGDRILALIRGSAVLHDGHASGLTVPNPGSQTAVIRAALERAGVEPSAVSLIEAHGTGTPLGDPIEVRALTEVFAGRSERLWLGSHKTNLGHLESAAGITGVLKVVLAMQHGVIPPHLHLEHLNPDIDLTPLHAEIPRHAVAWEPRSGRRIAGVSSFGISGTNVHVVLEQARPGPAHVAPDTAAIPDADAGPWLLPLSGHSLASVAARAEQIADRVATASPRELEDIAFTLGRHRDHHALRLAVVGKRDELPALLRTAQSVRAGRRPRLIFVFAGQGSQKLGMVRELYAAEPRFRASLDALSAAFAPVLGWSLCDEIHASEADSRLDRVEIVQPLLSAIQIALAHLLESWGLRPDGVIGHSMGEVAAAVVSGALDLEDGGRVIGLRSRLVAERAPVGGMAIVELSRAEAEAEIGDQLHLAAVNGPQTVLLAGEPEALDRFGHTLTARGRFYRRVAVGYASHSPGMDVLLEPLQTMLAGLRPRPASTTMYSTVRARAVAGGELDPSYWADNLREPVRFDEVVLDLLSRGNVTFVEIGPHPVLGYGIKQWCAEQDGKGVCLPSLRHDVGDRRSMLELVARLYERGHEVDWSALAGEGRFVELPSYPWDRQRHWPAAGPARSSSEGWVIAEAGTEGGRAFALQLVGEGWLADHRVGELIVVPGAAYLVWARRAVGPQVEQVEVRELQIESALTLDEGESVEVQTVCRVIEPGLWEVEVLSAKGETWLRHARGRLRLSEATAPNNGPATLAEVRRRCRERLAGDALYRRMAAGGLRYGPAFRGIDELHLGTDETLAELRTTDEVARAGALHPAWVDAAQHAVAPLLSAGRWLPIAVESLQVYAPVPERALVHATLRRDHAQGADPRRVFADLTVYTREDLAVACMRGLTLHLVESTVSARDELRLFEDTWAPGELEVAKVTPQGRWLLYGGEPALIGPITEALETLGLAVRHLAAADSPAPEDLAGATVLTFTTDAPTTLWQPLQKLTEVAAEPARVVLVTCGAWSPDGDATPVDPLAHAAWGLGRTLRHELPAWDLSLIDLDPQAGPRGASIAAMLEHLFAGDEERELAFRAGRRWLTRWRDLPLPPAPPQRYADAGDRAFALTSAQPGDLGSLSLREFDRAAPGPGEVEIEIEAAGVSFSDVLKAHGLYPLRDGEDGPRLGVEGSGRIARLGPNVSDWSIGDPVIAILDGGGFASHAIARTSLIARRPDNLSPTAAATLPGVFLTAFHALVTLAAIQPGERVLIHSAAGGVGQAAMQIALDAGAEVYGTAGTPEKRALLLELGCKQAWDSRSHGWFAGLREATDGEGVDVVLNTLPGEDLRLGLEILRSGGRFLEIGRTDIYANRRLGMEVFRKNVGFFAVDIGEPALLASATLSADFRELVARVASGRYQPLPCRVWPIERGAEALREMARGRHTGKLVLQVRDLQGAAPRVLLPVAGSFELNSFGGTWILTGGTGALGLACARMLVAAGVGRLVLVGRRPPSPEAEATIADLRRRGAAVDVAACDVAVREQVAALIHAHEDALEGVIHCAGVLDDALLRDLDDARAARVIAAKVYGAQHLHELTRELPLMHFVLFSSLSGVLGSPGQGAYALANAWLDGLALRRQAEGLPALSVAWGAWKDIGLAAADERRGARLARRGLPSLRPEAGVEMLARLLTGDAMPACVSATPLDWPAYREAQPQMAKTPRFALLDTEAPSNVGAPTLNLEQLFADATGPQDRRRALERWIHERAAAVLGVALTQINRDQPLAELGLDSLMSLELRNSLQVLARDKLPSTLLFTYPSVTALTDHLLEQLTPASDPAPMIESAHEVEPAHEVDAPAGEAELGSDEEVVAALLRELADQMS